VTSRSIPLEEDPQPAKRQAMATIAARLALPHVLSFLKVS